MRTPGSKLEETKSALKHLEEDFDAKNMLLEGGAIINGNLLKMGLVDELSLIIYPGIDGKSDHPSIIECQCGEESPMEASKLELKSCETVGSGFVWIRYAIHH